jgi:glucokinase
MKPKAIIGIDLGGTNVRAGVVTTNGQLLTDRDTPINAIEGPEIGLQRIIQLIENVRTEANIEIEAVGIGCTGPLDRIAGTINNPYTLPTWENVNINQSLQDHFSVPICLENDADAAALGESWMGAGRGLSRVLMVTVGTGVGTGFILDGKIYRGMAGVHPEGGHIPIDPAGPLCYCGAKGCLESLASGSGIAAFAQSRVLGTSSILMTKTSHNPEKITAEMVMDAAQAGDALAAEIVQQSATHLALGLINLLHLYLPDCVVFSGGVMHSFSLYKPRLEEMIKSHSIMSPLDKIPLLLAQLGQKAGIYGAARAAMLEHIIQT